MVNLKVPHYKLCKVKWFKWITTKIVASAEKYKLSKKLILQVKYTFKFIIQM